MVSQNLLALIEKRGTAYILAICSYMRERNIQYCELQANVVNYRVHEPKDRANVYSYDELFNAVSDYHEIMAANDKAFQKLRDAFEPIARQTDFCQAHANSESFIFFNGKYTNEITQAMFEVFLKCQPTRNN